MEAFDEELFSGKETGDAAKPFTIKLTRTDAEGYGPPRTWDTWKLALPTPIVGAVRVIGRLGVWPTCEVKM
jgi:hypothetical protein